MNINMLMDKHADEKYYLTIDSCFSKSYLYLIIYFCFLYVFGGGEGL